MKPAVKNVLIGTLSCLFTVMACVIGGCVLYINMLRAENNSLVSDNITLQASLLKEFDELKVKTDQLTYQMKEAVLYEIIPINRTPPKDDLPEVPDE